MLTRREWGFAAAGAALGGVGCSSPDPGSPDAGSATPAADIEQRTLLERSIVVDLHCDTPMLISAEGYDLGERHDYGQVDIPRMRQGGVTGIFFSIWTSATARSPTASVKKALEIIDEVLVEVRRHPEDLALATTSAEIAAAKQHNKIAVLMGVEGGHMIDSSLGVLRTFFELGVRYLTLTHNGHTPWADCAALKPQSRGLTEFGRDVVREMNRLGMMVDISHVSDDTFYDALETSSAPIIASHSSCRAIANQGRNMTDDMLRALANNGGVVHINYFNGFLDHERNPFTSALKDLDAKATAVRKEYAGDQKQQSVELRKIDQERLQRVGRVPFSKLLDHFEHAAKVAGLDHVGLGSDFDGVSDQLPEGMEDISKIPNLIAGLQERGFSDDDIQKILGGNTLRVMKQVETAAAASATRTTTGEATP